MHTECKIQINKFDKKDNIKDNIMMYIKTNLYRWKIDPKWRKMHILIFKKDAISYFFKLEFIIFLLFYKTRYVNLYKRRKFLIQLRYIWTQLRF